MRRPKVLFANVRQTGPPELLVHNDSGRGLCKRQKGCTAVRGHVRKRGEAWAYVHDLPPGPDGKRRQHWRSGFKTKGEAQRALSEALSKLEQGTFVEPSKVTVAEYMKQWIPSIEMELRPRTLASYRLNVETHIIPRLGHFRLQALSPTHIKSFYSDLLSEGRSDGSGGLSPRTVQYVGTILGRALRDAESQRLIQRNPAAAVRKPKPSSRKASINTWTGEELRRFLDAVKDERIFPVLLLAATTGLRRGELLGLTWRQVDLDVGRLRVVQALVVVGGEFRLTPPKRESSVRSIAVDPTTVEVLRRWRKRQHEERLAWGPAYDNQDLVFSREDGSPINPDWLTRKFAALVRQVNVPPIRLHDLRHTHATLALQANVHPKVIAERLGHSSVMITLDTYSHAIPSLQEEAAEKVAGIVFGA